MKQFEIYLTWRDDEGKTIQIDKVEADNLVHLLTQFMLIIVQLQKKIDERAIAKFQEVTDDDIPF